MWRQGASLTPEERAAEDRAWDAELQQITTEAEHEARTLLKVRRAGDDTIIKLPSAVLISKGSQPLCALRCSTEDIYFQADDGSWYRIALALSRLAMAARADTARGGR